MTTATFFTTQTASPTNTAIAEINYNPDEPTAAEMAAPGWNAAWDAQEFEFIELRNFGTQPVDLSGVKFVTGIGFQFPSPGGPILSPGQSIVLVKNQTAFEIRYGAGINIGGTFTGSLNNGGEQLTLRTAADVLIRDITYDNSGAWPGRADGKGSTLEIITPTADGNLDASWRNSIEYNGTPGAIGIGAINSIVVNEVLTHTDPPLVDAVEFHNPTGACNRPWRLVLKRRRRQLSEVPDPQRHRDPRRRLSGARRKPLQPHAGSGAQLLVQ